MRGVFFADKNNVNTDDLKKKQKLTHTHAHTHAHAHECTHTRTSTQRYAAVLPWVTAVQAMFQLTRAFVPLLKEASNGNLDPSHVVNVSSTAGNMNSSSPLDNAPSYAASKAAANKVTQILASYLVKDHINVNCTSHVSLMGMSYF